MRVTEPQRIVLEELRDGAELRWGRVAGSSQDRWYLYNGRCERWLPTRPTVERLVRGAYLAPVASATGKDGVAYALADAGRALLEAHPEPPGSWARFRTGPRAW